MIKKKELKTGDVIKIKEGADAIKLEGEGVTAIKCALDSMAESLQRRSEGLWKTIKAFYPETEGWRCKIKCDEEGLSIEILYKEDII